MELSVNQSNINVSTDNTAIEVNPTLSNIIIRVDSDNMQVSSIEVANNDISVNVSGNETIVVQSNEITLMKVGGPAGDDGIGIPAGGISGQVLAKNSNADYDTGWVNQTGGGGGGAVDSVNGQTGVVVLDTDDIADTAANRYTNDTDITRLADTSGTNTGDQDLSGYLQGVAQGENISVDNTDPENPVISSSGQADPNGTILGTGVATNEFRYNEVIEQVKTTPLYLTDADIYKTYTTDGSTDFTVD